MKAFVFFFLSTFIPLSSYPQVVSVELSVEWQLEQVFLRMLSSYALPVPYLLVTYRNLSNENVYLNKVIPDEYFLPNTYSGLLNTEMQYDERVLNIGDYSKDKYVYSLNYFSAEFCSTDQTTDHELAVINNDLADLYMVLSLQKLLNEQGMQKQLRCFIYPDKEYVTYRKAAEMLGVHQTRSKKNEMMFLEAKEFKQQKISLLGLMTVKGSYCIEIANPESLLPLLEEHIFEGKIFNAVKEDVELTNKVLVTF